jgi:hypothetical protein
MIAGAFAGLVVLTPVGRPVDTAKSALTAAIIGALGGVLLEWLIRPAQPKTKSPWRYGIRELLIAMAIAAIGLWIITALLKR